MVAMIKKLFERSPLGSSLLKSAVVLDPDILMQTTRDKLTNSFASLLNVIKNLSVLNPNSCDKALSQFKFFLDNNVKQLVRDVVLFS